MSEMPCDSKTVRLGDIGLKAPHTNQSFVDGEHLHQFGEVVIRTLRNSDDPWVRNAKAFVVNPVVGSSREVSFAPLSDSSDPTGVEMLVGKGRLRLLALRIDHGKTTEIPILSATGGHTTRGIDNCVELIDAGTDVTAMGSNTFRSAPAGFPPGIDDAVAILNKAMADANGWENSRTPRRGSYGHDTYAGSFEAMVEARADLANVSKEDLAGAAHRGWVETYRYWKRRRRTACSRTPSPRSSRAPPPGPPPAAAEAPTSERPRATLFFAVFEPGPPDRYTVASLTARALASLATHRGLGSATMSGRDVMNIHEMLRAQMRKGVAEERRQIAPVLAGRRAPAARDAPVGRPLSREASFASYDGDEAKEGFHGGAGAPGLPAGHPAGGYPRRAVCGERSLYRTQIDTHELLKREAFGSKVATCDDHFEKSRPCPSEVYGVSDHYITLDSYEKVDSSETHRGVFRFNFMVSGETRDQNIGARDQVSTAIAIQVGHFTAPLLPIDDFEPAVLEELDPGLSELGLAANGALPTADHLDNPMRQSPYRRLTLYLQELGKQAFLDRNSRRHQFEFTTLLAGRDEPAADLADGDRYHFAPLRDYEYYVLTKPLQDVHGLTLSFYNPDEPVRFPPDTMYAVTVGVDANSKLEFTYTDPHNLINLEVGDRVFVENFEYVRHATDAAGNVTSTPYSILNGYLNRPEGHLVGADYSAANVPFVLPAKSAAGMTITFRLNPDVDTSNTKPAAIGAGTLAKVAPSAAAGTVDSLEKVVRIRIAKNRMRIPLRIRTVVEGLTNYIAP